VDVSLKLTGDVPWWLGLILAAVAAGAAWALYRREMRSRARALTRWLLPLLRAAAICGIVLVLTGPVLKHRRTIDRPRRVLVFVDGSASMSVDDRYESLCRKLLVARAHGWLPAEVLDTSLARAAEALAETRQTAAAGRRPGSSITVLRRACVGFARQVGAVGGQLGAIDGAKAPTAAGEPLATFVQRFGREIVGAADALAQQPIERANQIEVRRQLYALTQAAGRCEVQLRAYFAAYARALVASGSPAVRDALEKHDALSRWQRVESLLLAERSGVLRSLAEDHDVELLVLPGSRQEAVVPLWHRGDSAELPKTLPDEPKGAATDLATGLAGRLTTAAQGPGPVKAGQGAAPTRPQRAAIVLISDGRHNRGPAPSQVARLLGERQVPVFAVGLGWDRPRPDLAIVGLRHSEVVFHDDRVRGHVELRDDMPPGTAFLVRIERGDDVLWERTITTAGGGRRRIPFDVSIGEVVKAELEAMKGRNLAVTSLPLAMNVSITPLAGEDRRDNNDYPLHVVKAMPRETKLLILDGRPRWETRYLRNLFARDTRWKVNRLLPAGKGDLKTGDGAGTFPADRASLLAYDLVIFGEVRAGTLSEEQLKWLRDFVQARGGGLIFVDGRRGHLRSYADTPLGELLPVKWAGKGPASPPQKLQLTEAGAARPFLSLVGDPQQSAALWGALPAPRWAAAAEVLPGAETLVEAVTKQGKRPAIVLRRAGAGRVLYCGFDESWRWRYEVADEYHQRYWNQVGNAIRERPFAAGDRFVSLDTQKMIYQAGQKADIRARLRDARGRPILQAAAEAVLSRDGKEAARVRLQADRNAGGLFRGITPPLAEGRYTVRLRADGIPEEQMRATLQFAVLPAASVELAQLAANPSLLKQIAAGSGGKYLSEERAHELPRLLDPLADRQVIESETVLWQSYWWFLPVVLILGLELLLRKWNGLL
jgi:hypothetical protein